MEDRQKTSLIMLFFFCGPLTERLPEVFVQLDCPLFQASFGEVSCHHHPFNVHTLYGVPAAPAPDHHPQPPFPPADRDHSPPGTPDLCGTVEGLLHERCLDL